MNVRASRHAICRHWLNDVTDAGDVLLLNDLTECAFLRISTLPGLGLSTLPVSLKFWNRLAEYPHAERLAPGPSHHQIFSGFMTGLNLRGNDVNDAWLAALAVEHRVTHVSTDDG